MAAGRGDVPSRESRHVLGPQSPHLPFEPPNEDRATSTGLLGAGRTQGCSWGSCSEPGVAELREPSRPRFPPVGAKLPASVPQPEERSVLGSIRTRAVTPLEKERGADEVPQEGAPVLTGVQEKPR